jgi:hypothetical protein
MHPKANYSDDLAAAAEQVFSQPIRIVNVLPMDFPTIKIDGALPLVAKTGNGLQNMLQLSLVCGRAQLRKKRKLYRESIYSQVKPLSHLLHVYPNREAVR